MAFDNKETVTKPITVTNFTEILVKVYIAGNEDNVLNTITFNIIIWKTLTFVPRPRLRKTKPALVQEQPVTTEAKVKKKTVIVIKTLF